MVCETNSILHLRVYLFLLMEAIIWIPEPINLSLEKVLSDKYSLQKK